jgi:hypothetical protein
MHKMDWSITRELQDIEYYTSLENDREKDRKQALKLKQDELDKIKQDILNAPDIQLTLPQLREARILRLSQKTVQDVNAK